jgi:hypothetical protein
LANPAEVEKALKTDPEIFGALSGANRSQVGLIYRALTLGRTSPALNATARAFEGARMAGLELDAISSEHPSEYRDLQRERAVRGVDRASKKKFVRKFMVRRTADDN